MRSVDWYESCSSIEAKYHLTSRESEVFRLLSIGRNVNRISERLSISTSTVKSHTYRIYNKLGIHSQQDLIDLVEFLGSRSTLG